MAYIRYDPNEPGDKERAVGLYILATISIYGSLAAIIYFIASFIPVFKGMFSMNVIYSSCFLILMSIVVYFYLLLQSDFKKRFVLAKKFFLLFFGGALGLVGTIGIFTALISLGRGGNGLALLVCSIISVSVLFLTVFLLYSRLENRKPIKLFTDEQTASKFKTTTLTINKEQPIEKNSTVPEMKYIYCHRCGKKLLEDSDFCSFCGTRVK